MSNGERPYVRVEPGLLFGQPTVGLQRISVEQMADYWWETGDSLAHMQANWDLTRGDLLVAWWFRAQYGGRVWKRRWGAWAEASFDALWHLQFDGPLPPRKGEP